MASSTKFTYLTTRAVSHRERVCSLYKKTLRLIEAYVVDRPEYRYRAVIMRHRFDCNKNIQDMRVAKKMVEDGEEQLFLNQHPIPFQYQYSPGGSAYDREPPSPDWLADMWHPLEKASYPKYFARREKRKEEFMAFWQKHFNRGQKWDEHEKEFKGGFDEKFPNEVPPSKHGGHH